MSALQAYRDDGPLARWVAGQMAIAGAAGEGPHPLAWLVPPLLRLLEYGSLIALTALSDPDALPACFAFLGVLAFHQYDVVYRLRHQRLAPPAWVQAVGGGWEGRLVVALVLALAGVLGPALVVAAVGLALVYVTESVSSWLRFGKAGGTGPREEEDEVEELE